MLLAKKTTIFNPKVGYLLLYTDQFLYAEEGMDYDKDTPYYDNGDKQSAVKRIHLYNGPINFFRSLVELNDHLGGLDINNGSSDHHIYIYKGHLFPGKKFPLEPKKGYDKFFIIEKVDDSICFAEESNSLEEVANSIEGDLTTLSDSDSGEKNLLSNYLVFAGNKKKPIYHCIDSEMEEQIDDT